MRVQLRMNYEMNRQLRRDNDLSLAAYHVLNALSNAPDYGMRVTALASMIGWEISRTSHQLRRLSARGLTERIQPADDRRATDAVLSQEGLDAIVAATPDHVALVRRLFFASLPEELIGPFTAAMEHVHASLDLNSSWSPSCR